MPPRGFHFARANSATYKRPISTLCFNTTIRNKQGNPLSLSFFLSLSFSLSRTSLFVVLALLVWFILLRRHVLGVFPLRLLVHVIDVVDLRGGACLN